MVEVMPWSVQRICMLFCSVTILPSGVICDGVRVPASATDCTAWVSAHQLERSNSGAAELNRSLEYRFDWSGGPSRRQFDLGTTQVTAVGLMGGGHHVMDVVHSNVVVVDVNPPVVKCGWEIAATQLPATFCVCATDNCGIRELRLPEESVRCYPARAGENADGDPTTTRCSVQVNSGTGSITVEDFHPSGGTIMWTVIAFDGVHLTSEQCMLRVLGKSGVLRESKYINAFKDVVGYFKQIKLGK